MNSKNHYDVLKVHKNASADQIKESYRRLAREYHPDKNPNHNDEFKEISAAYDVLSDPSKRRDFDQQQAAKRRVPAPEPSEMFNFGYPDLFQHHFDVFDHILNNFARTTPHFHRHRNSHFDDLFFGFHSFGFNHNRPRREYTQGQAHRSHAHGSTHANIPASHMYRRPHSPTQPSRSSQKNASNPERPTRVRIWPRTEEPKKSEEEKEPEVITIDENEDLVSDEMEPEIEVITIDSDEEDTIIVDE